MNYIYHFNKWITVSNFLVSKVINKGLMWHIKDWEPYIKIIKVVSTVVIILSSTFTLSYVLENIKVSREGRWPSVLTCNNQEFITCVVIYINDLHANCRFIHKYVIFFIYTVAIIERVWKSISIIFIILFYCFCFNLTQWNHSSSHSTKRYKLQWFVKKNKKKRTGIELQFTAFQSVTLTSALNISCIPLLIN